MVIRGLLPISGPWEQLLLYELQKFYPKFGGDWRPSFQWSFMEHNKLAISTKWEDIFARSALNSWKDVFVNLVKRSPTIEIELCRQRLIWNSIFTNHRGNMLGRHTQCTLGKLDRGLAQSIGAWTTFLSTVIDQRMIMLNNIRGKKAMYYVIQATLSNI